MEDDAAIAASLESRVANVRATIEKFEVRIKSAKKEAADLKAKNEKKDKKHKDKETPGESSSGRERSRSPERKSDDERAAMLTLDISTWEQKLPILKGQHNQMKLAADAFNTTSAGLKTGLGDLDFD